jgi:hypothetical protein
VGSAIAGGVERILKLGRIGKTMSENLDIFRPGSVIASNFEALSACWRIRAKFGLASKNSVDTFLIV